MPVHSNPSSGLWSGICSGNGATERESGTASRSPDCAPRSTPFDCPILLTSLQQTSRAPLKFRGAHVHSRRGIPDKRNYVNSQRRRRNFHSSLNTRVSVGSRAARSSTADCRAASGPNRFSLCWESLSPALNPAACPLPGDGRVAAQYRLDVYPDGHVAVGGKHPAEAAFLAEHGVVEHGVAVS